MTRALSHRTGLPFMVIVPDDPEAIKLLRLLLFLFNFLWRNRAEIFLLIENVNRLFDVIEAVLEICGICYDGWEWILCNLKSGSKRIISNCT